MGNLLWIIIVVLVILWLAGFAMHIGGGLIHLLIVIADVSGKGVSAAIIMSSVQAALRVAAPIESDLPMLVARLNALVYRSTKGSKYVTAFIGRYTPSTGELTYVNAGHNPPFIVTDGAVQRLDSTGKPIGILPDSRFTSESTTLARGATLFLYTDGLNEATNADDEELGNERLEELIVRAAGAPPRTMASQVLDAITTFEEGIHASDDKTVVVLRRRMKDEG